MNYDAELRFLREVCKKLRVLTTIVDPDQPLAPQSELYLLRLLTQNNQAITLADLLPPIEEKVVYRLKDEFSRIYLYCLLPDMPQRAVLMLGPFSHTEMNHQQILETAEKHHLDPQQTKVLEAYCQSVPLVNEENSFFVALDVFCERLWGNFQLVDINAEAEISVLPAVFKRETNDPEHMQWNMQMMEERYAYENELIQAVAQGQSHKAELLFSGFSVASFERRLSDPVRNIKNYGIIMNTLLRKAAEQGGVHPIYLDSISSSFARQIEAASSAGTAQKVMSEMARSYCRLVRKHSMKNYSPPVQKAILYIDADLTADLSLSALAGAQNISPSYLSSLFRQETGQTLTDHVNHKRIKQAMQLLSTTHLQVQTVAQHCGILDVHYFSKVFKKYTGQTPKQYRETHRH